MLTLSVTFYVVYCLHPSFFNTTLPVPSPLRRFVQFPPVSVQFPARFVQFLARSLQFPSRHCPFPSRFLSLLFRYRPFFRRCVLVFLLSFRLVTVSFDSLFVPSPSRPVPSRFVPFCPRVFPYRSHVSFHSVTGPLCSVPVRFSSFHYLHFLLHIAFLRRPCPFLTPVLFR